jgi:hypothetical protein
MSDVGVEEARQLLVITAHIQPHWVTLGSGLNRQTVREEILFIISD